MLTCCLNSLVEDGSQGDGRGLDGRKVCEGVMLAGCAGVLKKLLVALEHRKKLACLHWLGGEELRLNGLCLV